MSACCNAASGRKAPTWARRIREMLAWALPSVLLALVPKCPACLAAHVALWTGLGLSLSTATYLRWALLLVCIASLLLLVVTRLTSHRTKLIDDCAANEPLQPRPLAGGRSPSGQAQSQWKATPGQSPGLH